LNERGGIHDKKIGDIARGVQVRGLLVQEGRRLKGFPVFGGGRLLTNNPERRKN